jgi:putative copper resistance protein D
LDAATLSLILARFAHFAALALLFGASIFPTYAGPFESNSPSAGSAPITAALIAVVSGAAWFALTTANMAGSLSAAWDGASLLTVVTETSFGGLWLGRMAALLLVAILLRFQNKTARVVTIALSAGALTSLAWTGHANGTAGEPRLVHRLTDVLHLLAAGLWIGALPMLAQRLQASRAAAFEAVFRFSRVAVPTVALLLATGVANTFLIFAGPQDLVGTTYGRWLCVKLAFVAAMVGLAVINRQRLTPSLQGGSIVAQKQLRRNALIELALGLCVLAVVAVLGALSPVEH